MTAPGRGPLGVALAVSLGAGWPCAAHAHIQLVFPPAREVELKQGPCGGTLGYPADAALTSAFPPGATLTMRWHETIAHPGYFRIALSMDGESFPADPTDPPPDAEFPVLAIVPKVDGQTEYEVTLTLPDEECPRCSVQLIQYMREHAPPPYYYQCADLVIEEGVPPGGVPATAARNPAEDSNAPNDATSAAVEGSGCEVARPRARPESWFVPLALLTLFGVRRRPRRKPSHSR